GRTACLLPPLGPAHVPDLGPAGADRAPTPPHLPRRLLPRQRRRVAVPAVVPAAGQGPEPGGSGPGPADRPSTRAPPGLAVPRVGRPAGTRLRAVEERAGVVLVLGAGPRQPLRGPGGGQCRAVRPGVRRVPGPERRQHKKAPY